MLASNERCWTHRNHKQATQFSTINQFFIISADGSISITGGTNHAFDYGCGLRPIIRLRADVTIDGGNGSANNPYKIVESPIGLYVDYNAGDWTLEDFQLIENSPSKVKPTVSGEAKIPTQQGEFGGFTVGQSRNDNATSFVFQGVTYAANSSGWRIWDVDEKSGDITLIHAGVSEQFFSTYGKGLESADILKKRNVSMYENNYAKENSAHFLTAEEAADWYNKQAGTNYTINEGNLTNSTFKAILFPKLEPYSVLQNGAHVWAATAADSDQLYSIYNGTNENINKSGGSYGVRCKSISYIKIRSANRQKQWRWNGKKSI